MLTRKKVIDNLESYMESTNQTQTDIAKRLQVTPQAINNWLTRRREPSEETGDGSLSPFPVTLEPVFATSIGARSPAGVRACFG